MSTTTWKPAWYGLVATGDGWEVTINQTSSAHTWEAECFGRSETGDADTEDEAKAAALTWIADALREVPTRAARALAEIGEKAPTSPDSASESATLPETPPAATESPVGLVWRECGYGFVVKGDGFRASVMTLTYSRAQWRWSVYATGNPRGHQVGEGEAPTLDAAKAAAEACLRAWVAQLNASLGGA